MSDCCTKWRSKTDRQTERRGGRGGGRVVKEKGVKNLLRRLSSSQIPKLSGFFILHFVFFPHFFFSSSSSSSYSSSFFFYIYIFRVCVRKKGRKERSERSSVLPVHLAGSNSPRSFGGNARSSVSEKSNLHPNIQRGGRQEEGEGVRGGVKWPPFKFTNTTQNIIKKVKV